MNQNTKRRWLAALLGAAAGMVVFFLLYGTSTLHPTYDAWILNGYDEWDIQQHYAGWVLFRNSHWAFPLGLADTIAAPDGTVISFTDSIPWVSIFFKALRGVLPSTFQWFGWYTLFCFAMQGAAGALLCARGQAKTGAGALVFSTLGGLLFVMLPTLWERAFRHTALASQWLFLLALYAFLEYRQNLHSGTAKFPWVMPVLAFLAVGIHPYFLPLVMMCALLAAVELGRQKKAWGRAALQFAASLAAAVVGGVLCGAIGSGTGASRSGYGDYSMNLNALINPTSRGGYTWSRLYQVMPQQPGQYDGFNYLGLGVLALITAALLFSLRRALRCPQNTKTWWHRNGPVFAACVFLTLFAVSNKIYWGNTGIELPLPAKLLELCGIFRSSGRMFYLAAACMVVYAVYTLRDRLPGRYAVLVLALFVGAQAFDLSAAAQQKRQKFADPINATVVNNDQTASLVVAQLLYLEAQDPDKDIQMYINSPGGSVTAGMAIYDTMQYIKCDVSTICIGMAASMGAFLLAAGTKGKRMALPNAEIMIHQPSAGTQGQITDMAIHLKRLEVIKKRMNHILSENTGKPLDVVTADCERDNFMSAQEAMEYGLIDKVIDKR